MAKETSSGINEVSNMKISNAKEIDLDKIIDENSGVQKKEEYFFEEMDLEYITKYRNNSNLPKGVIEVKQEGREGKQKITKKRVYENGEVISEEQVGSKVIKAAVDKIVEVNNGICIRFCNRIFYCTNWCKNFKIGIDNSFFI